MDKMGLGALIAGIILIVLGAFGIYTFLPEVIFLIKGLIGLVGVVLGLFLLVFGILMIKE